MDLVLFGIQGSGKGTQAKRLADEFGYEIFETGAELRRIIGSGSELGKTVASYIDKGHHAPLEIVMQVVKDAVMLRPKGQKILFDGIPRNLDQMHRFDVMMAETGREFRCLRLVIPRETAVERIMGRAQEQGRVDDADEDAVRRRLDLFDEKTVPVIEHYASRGNMIEIDGMGTMDEVYNRLKNVVTEWMSAQTA
jgi:adenylate kinase